MTLTAEEVERDLRPARPFLNGMARGFGEKGHEEAAVVLGALTADDKDDALAAFYVALEHASPEERELAQRGLWVVAHQVREKHPAATLRLTEVLEMSGELYGLPGEEDEDG